MRILKSFQFLFLSVLILIPIELHATPRLPGNVTVLTREDFNGRNFFSVADALINLTSINVEKDGYRGTLAVAKMRGTSNTNQVLILIDGRPLNRIFNSMVDLSQISLSLVERIEITRGGTPAPFVAEGAAGTIHIITSRPKQKGVIARFASGVGRDGVKYSDGRLRGRGYFGDFTYLGGIQDSSGYMDNELMKSSSHFGNWTRSFNGQGHIGVEYYLQDSEVGVANGTQLPFNQWNRKLERNSSDTTQERQQELQHVKVILASPEWAIGTFDANHVHTFRDTDLFAADAMPSIQDDDYKGSHSTLRWRWKGFEAGGERHWVKRELFPTQAQTYQQSGVYILKQFSHSKFMFKPAVRYDHLMNTGGQVNPRGVLLFAPFKSLSISGSAAKSFRAPTFAELLLNPNIDPENVITYDVGFHWIPGSLFDLNVNGFISQLDELIQTSGGTLINNGEEKREGVEIRLNSEVGKNTKYLHFILNGDWTFQRSRQDFKNGIGFVNTALAPRHVAVGRLHHKLPLKMTLTNELRHQSEQFELANNAGVRLPGYTIWNVRFQVNIHQALLYFTVENVTQVRYADNVAASNSGTVFAPQAERTYFTGFSIKFIN